MNYKKIIKNRELRRKILSYLSFIPDALMLKIQYRLQLGRKLNLKNPERYTEKIQYYKLNYKNPILTKCVDKYEVRDYVTSQGCADYLVRCFGIYTDAEQINFEEFPMQFVLKDTLGGGGNSVIVVTDKNKMDKSAAITQISKWLERPNNIKSDGREWPYYCGLPHRVIAEEYIDGGTTGLYDYKFFCFDGKVAYVYVIGNRIIGEHGELAIMDRDFNRLPYQSATQAVMLSDPEKPRNYDCMVEVAEKLSVGFPHVRVDLYNVEGRVIFGELTFYGASGYQRFNPDEFDFILGKCFTHIGGVLPSNI